jgi:hypothetical protein
MLSALKFALKLQQPSISNRVSSVNGLFNSNQYNLNTSQVSVPSPWSIATDFPVELGNSYGDGLVAGNKAYIVAGYQSSVYSATILDNGTLSSWSNVSTYPIADIRGGACFIAYNRLFYLGGVNSSNNGYSLCYNNLLNPDYTLSSWTQLASLPVGLYYSSYILTRKGIYILGGKQNPYVSNRNIYFSKILKTGIISSWETVGTTSFDVMKVLAVIGNKVYITDNSDTLKIYKVTISNDGSLSSFSFYANCPIPSYNIFQNRILVTRTKLYVFGPYQQIYQSPIDGSGNIGDFTIAGYLPDAISRGPSIITTATKIYLMGIFWNHTNYYYAPFSGGLNEYPTY